VRHTQSRRGSRWFGHLPQKVERAPNACSTVKYVRVDHRGVAVTRALAPDPIAHQPLQRQHYGALSVALHEKHVRLFARRGPRR